MIVKLVALLTMVSMTMNGFLPKSVMELSRNTFLVDAIACQTVFLDFLHLSDKSLVEIAVKTVGDMSMVAPLARGAGSEESATPWADACQALSSTSDQVTTLFAGMMKQDLPAPAKSEAPSTQPVDDTSSDYLLFNNELRLDMVFQTAMRGSAWMACGVSALCALRGWQEQRTVPWEDGGGMIMRTVVRPEQAVAGGIGDSGRSVPIYMAERFESILPRGDVSIAMQVRVMR